MDFVKTLHDNWGVLSAAPWAFLSIAVLIGGGGLLLGRFWQNGVVANLKSRLELRDDRIAEYERKLGGTTPDDVLRTIADLESSLKMLGDPRLFTQEQIDKMSGVLRGAPGDIFISRDNGSVDSAKVYTQIKRLLKTEGWKVTGGAVWGIDNPPECGLTVITRTGDKHSPQEIALVAALNAAGVTYDIRREEPNERQPQLQLNFSEMD
ncbi:hypothetical protein I6F15_00600 [Bradyrhizobium sp. BRP14]|nr:hypothetical protein [Bradyrhizobium sp. BRP14]